MLLHPRCLTLAAILLIAHPALGEEITGRVVGVADGDTITLLDAAKVQRKVRLAGIDAPEKAQPFGNRSKENLSALVFGKVVRTDCYKRDRYGRQVCRVWEANADVALAQLTVGLAWHYKTYTKEQAPDERARYSLAEDEARARRVGLWQDAQPVPPWEWRRRAKRERP